MKASAQRLDEPISPSKPDSEVTVHRVKTTRSRYGPPVPAGWTEVFIEQVRKTGGFFKAADVAGVHPKTATRHMNAHPEFHEAVKNAREFHADQLEEELEGMGRANKNPVPHIVRLKALRPSQYIEKHATFSVTADVSLSVSAGRELLESMIGHSIPAHLPHSTAQVVNMTSSIEGRILSENAQEPTP